MAEDKKAIATRLVTAYLRNNSVAAKDIPDLIQNAYAAVVGAVEPLPEPVERQQPAIPLKKSVTAEYILCLDCGKPQKMLKRHLSTAHGLTVDEYRAKWGLAEDYPMVAPNYAQHRSHLAIKIGLGRKRTVEEVAVVAPVPAPVVAPVAAPVVQPVVPEEPPQPEEPRQHRYPASRWAKPKD